MGFPNYLQLSGFHFCLLYVLSSVSKLAVSICEHNVLTDYHLTEKRGTGESLSSLEVPLYLEHSEVGMIRLLSWVILMSLKVFSRTALA